MDFSAPSRVRTAAAAAGTSGCLMDFGASFQPSKRQKIASQDVEMRAENEPEPCQPSNGSLLDRLMYEVTFGAASNASSWRLSSDRSIAQNESYLNEQLEHAALLSGGTEITPQLCRLRFTALLEELETNHLRNQPEQQQQLQQLQCVVDQHVRHAMDIVSWLLVLRQQDLRQQETLMDRQRIITKDVDRKQNQLAQAALEIDALRQQLAQQENMFHAREQALVAERRALQQDKKHLEVLCAKLQGQETAFKAQLRRKDVEYERLKKSLQDAAQRSSKEPRGLAMGRPLNGTSERRQTSTTQRGTTTQSAETLLNRRLIETLERKRDDLLFENDALARSFETLQKQVESVCVQYKKAVQLFLAQRGGEDFDEQDSRTDETRELARVPIDDFTPMPLQLGVKANVAVFITETVDTLAQKVDLFERAMRSELEASMANPRDDLSDVVDALKEKLEHAHAVIAEQDRLLQASLLTSSSSSVLATGEREGKTTATEPNTSPEKENIHVNTGKHAQLQSQSQVHHGVASNRSGGHSERLRRRAPAHQVLLLEQWTDELSREWQEAKRKHKHLNDERSLLQRQAEKLDVDRLAFEQRKFTHFFGGGGGADDAPERQEEGEKEEEGEEEGDIVMQDMDCPTTPRTAAYLRSIGIVPSVLDLST